MTELIVGSLTSRHGKLTPVDVFYEINWHINRVVDISLDSPVIRGQSIDTSVSLEYETSKFKGVDISSGITWDILEKVNTSFSGKKAGTHPLENNSENSWDILEKFNTSFSGTKAGTHSVDADGTYSFQMVNLQGSKLDPLREFRYLPTSDFQIDSELIGFTSDFIEPIDLTVIRTRLSPVDQGTNFPWSRTRVVDIYQELSYGYSINNFLVGGSVGTDYLTDDDAINPPPDPPAVGGVTKIVNVINVVKLPERTPIDFVDFTLATDLNSIAWVVNFTIGSQASLDILKPVGLTTIEVEININGELFVCFIGRTKTIISAKQGGGVQKSYKCTGWSATKTLSHPYSTKRSHTETSASTPAGLLNDELTGTGYTGTWSSPTWTIPANVFTYLEKSPLAAITELADSIGSVIIPHATDKTLEVKPYYPVSPWDWDLAIADFNMNETEFYSMDTEWLPKESPDSVYVYGEETGGIAVKCVKTGTAGIVTLPTVVNKYITDTIAGTERGRIEVAKNAFKEIVPVTTYVDANDGIIKPQSLLSITPLTGTTWKGMVIGTSIAIKRNGTAVVQSLQIERHYD
jgi:hypothetical protein